MTLFNHRSIITSATFALLTVGVSTHAAVGQPGTLDLSFGTGGKVVSPVGSGNDAATAISIQRDGKLVLTGYCYVGTKAAFCAVRYAANGALDTTFGNGGKVTTPISNGPGNDYAFAHALQPDGKLVLAGTCAGPTNEDFCALRYNGDGTLDSTFGAGGKVITAVSNASDWGQGLALQPDGKIVLAGFCGGASDYKFCSLRYQADATLDTTFGNAGIAITQVGENVALAHSIALQPDGKLVLAGQCVRSSNYQFCAARYHASGALDTIFAANGAIGGPARALALQPDGKIVLAGRCVGANNYDFCTVRYLGDATLDTTFGIGGTVVTPIGGGFDEAYALALQPDGKLVLAGGCSGAVYDEFCAARYHANGTLDTSFGTGGKVTTAVGGGLNQAVSLALQSDGKLVLGGICDNGIDRDFCAIRYDGGPFGYQNCKPDIDGDGAFLATTDALIYTRVALGITGSAVVNGITFPANASRNTWPLVREYLMTQCGMSLQQ